MEPTDQQLFKLAQKGNVEELQEAINEKFPDDEGKEEVTDLIYQLLVVAQDFGSPDANEYIEALETAYYDVSGSETLALIYFELGTWYLFGEEGLPQDTQKSMNHLEYAKDLGVRESIQDMEKNLDEVREKLQGDTLTEFNKIFPKK